MHITRSGQSGYSPLLLACCPLTMYEKQCLCLILQVKRKEPLELEEGDMKRPRPSTPPDEDDEGL